ncbi:MAG: hypothetical protein IJ292_01310 [Clostridia bacterium]|nr:hypothetical protein [Clostridia bacterium]
MKRSEGKSFGRTDVHIRAVLNRSRDRHSRFEKPSAAVMFKLSERAKRIYICNKLFAGASVSPIWGSRRAYLRKLYAVFTAKGDAKNGTEEYY